VNRTAAEDAKNDPAARWRRAGFVAARLQDGNAIPEEGDEAAERVKAKGKMKTKTLETQHWLELIDGCRRNYLVQIDENGLLRWARNGVLVDTRPGEWKNAEGGQGIVPLDGTEDRAVEHRLRRQVTTLSGGPSVSSSSLSSVGGPQHYDGDPQQGKIKKAFASRFTSKGITDRLLKKTMKKNTWIYASNYSDTPTDNVFVGVKKTGGGMSLIVWIHRLLQHFNAFLEVLEARGADLHKVQRTKAEIALWG
ncbi:hypothetical protein DL93DRAFT_2051419, partial [Clavulina sp. PMI_390]